jgi:glycosyltransferase involved in cell wall biosynthesis
MKTDQNTLIILTPGFPHSEADTVCLPMQQRFIRTLKAQNPQLNIIILSFQYPYFKKKYSWYNTTVISFGGRNKGGLAKLLLRRKVNKVLTEISHKNKVLGILSFWYGECALAGKQFADKHAIQHYCWILGQDAKKENKYPGKIHIAATELIALSDFIQYEFKKNHGIKPQHIIPAGIDTRQFDGMIKEKDKDIIAVGSLIPLKQYEVLVNTVAAIKKQLPNVKAVLIGDGPEKNKLQKLIVAQGLQSNIILAGELQHTEVLQWMQRGKIFLHPSSYEGFGVVCAEALYAGCNVISFCRPMKQAVDHWHIVTSEEEMKQKAISILQDPQTPYTPVIFFTVTGMAEKIMQLFE